MKVKMQNVHTSDVVAVELLAKRTTWQNVYDVVHGGAKQTLSNAQGWFVQPESVEKFCASCGQRLTVEEALADHDSCATCQVNYPSSRQ